MSDDRIPFIDGVTPTATLSFFDAAGAADDDDDVRAAQGQATAAVEAEAQTRNAWHAARQVRNYPPAQLAELEAAATRATAAREQLVARLEQDTVTRGRRLHERAGTVLRRVLAPPEGLEPAADVLEQQALRQKLEGLDPTERERMLLNAAQTGTHRPLLRAVLTAPAPVWTSAQWPVLVRDQTAQELRDWLIAHTAPDLVREARTTWRLRGIAQRLALTPWQPQAAAAPAFVERDGVKVARP